MNSGRLIVPNTRDDALVFDGSITVKADYYNGEPYEGGTAWGTRYSRFFVGDIPDVPVDFVVNGHINEQDRGGGFEKRDPGVMRLTSSNTYGGKAANDGVTHVYGGTLLVDNDPTEGTATVEPFMQKSTLSLQWLMLVAEQCERTQAV